MSFQSILITLGYNINGGDMMQERSVKQYFSCFVSDRLWSKCVLTKKTVARCITGCFIKKQSVFSLITIKDHKYV